jgi:nicotinate-nucleotide adenylyltransferase
MITAALAPLPKFTMVDMEIHQGGPSFTIDTIRTLLQEEGAEKKQYYLILGEDSLKEFHTWKEVEELVVLAPPLIGTRPGGGGMPKSIPKSVAAAVHKGTTEISVMEISSTEIRKRLGLGLYCGHLLPAKVWEYINANEFYKTHEK